MTEFLSYFIYIIFCLSFLFSSPSYPTIAIARGVFEAALFHLRKGRELVHFAQEAWELGHPVAGASGNGGDGNTVVLPRKLDPLHVLYSQPALLAYGNAATEWAFLGKFNSMLQRGALLTDTVTTLALSTVDNSVAARMKRGGRGAHATLRVVWSPVEGECGTPPTDTPPTSDDEGGGRGDDGDGPSWVGRRWSWNVSVKEASGLAIVAKRAWVEFHVGDVLYVTKVRAKAVFNRFIYIFLVHRVT